MVNLSKAKIFNKFQSISLNLRKKPLFCEENHLAKDVFMCRQCQRLLCNCHLNEAILDINDHSLCLDCWESKYREEIVNFKEEMMLEFIKGLLED